MVLERIKRRTKILRSEDRISSNSREKDKRLPNIMNSNLRPKSRVKKTIKNKIMSKKNKRWSTNQ